MGTVTRMSSLGSRSRRDNRQRAITATSLLLVLPAASAVADTIFAPRFGAAATWTDNVLLAPPGDTLNAEVWQLLPGVYLKHDSEALHVKLDYQLQEYYYSGGEHGHSTFQNGTLTSEARLVPDWIFLDLGGGLGQSTVDPALTSSISALFPTGNFANESNGTATPIIRHAFGAVQVLAEYSWGFLHYQPVGQVNGTLPDANNQGGTFKLSNADPNARISWDASYVRQQTRYTNVAAPPWLYEAATADLGWLVSPGLRLTGQGGRESDLVKNVSAGGLDSTFWMAGFDWNPDNLNELRLMAGRRFFGNTYQAVARHQSRLVTLQASYSEAPTTSANALTPQVGAPPSNVIIPGVPTFQRVTPDVYVVKTFDAKVALTGRLTEVGLDLSSTEQNYLTVNGVIAAAPVDDRYRSATLYMTRRMGAQLQGVLSATVAHTGLRENTNATYNDQHYTARLNSLIGSRTTVSLTFDHWQRSGAQIFKVNWVTLNANMAFGNGPTAVFPNMPIAPIPVAPAALASAAVAPPFPSPLAMAPASGAWATPAAAGTAAP